MLWVCGDGSSTVTTDLLHALIYLLLTVITIAQRMRRRDTCSRTETALWITESQQRMIHFLKKKRFFLSLSISIGKNDECSALQGGDNKIRGSDPQ